ncbi:hypothetical protein [Pseudomonas aeruginosa]|uniref:hypothetical protein n=1 Tax=Pseudomonas aeruginosa TaxID=287 RepID=UPI000FFE70B5|nr:hypothetical protein [Pseudomonas aeruginosa]
MLEDGMELLMPSKRSKSRTSNRDEFPEKTKIQIRDMAGNICSFPGCRVRTHGSKVDESGAISIGDACHITAAAPGGPRYDPSLTSAQRKSASNGIWMCKVHARLIDVDDSKYSKEEITEWKRTAEQNANKLLGTPAYTENELEEASLKLLSRAINTSGKALDFPISETIYGYEKGLKELDPRFNITIERRNKELIHIITPETEPVDIKLNLKNTGEELINAGRSLVENGTPLIIPATAFNFSGSKLFEEIYNSVENKSTATLTIRRPIEKIRTNLYICKPDGDQALITSYESTKTFGTKRMTIEGSGLEGFFHTKVQVSSSGTNLKIDYNLDAWRNKDILELPYFNRLEKAFSQLKESHLIVEYELGHEAITLDTKNSPDTHKLTIPLHSLVHTLIAARTISKAAKIKLKIKNTKTDSEGYNKINKYAKIIKSSPQKAKNGEIKAEGYIVKDNLKEDTTIEELQSVLSIMQTEKEREEIKIFGNILLAPTTATTYSNLEVLLYCPLDTPDRVLFTATSTSDSYKTIHLIENEPWILKNPHP